LTARAARTDRRVCSLPSCRSGSATAGARPAGLRVWSLARPASPTRPSGRCSSAPGSRRPPALQQPANSYEWPCPGDLLHADWTLYARFQRPGHALTGDRSSTAADKKARLGYDFAHAIVDNHSRLAYAELLPDAKAATVYRVGFTNSIMLLRVGVQKPGRVRHPGC
jgi:hypothetical protein